MATTFAGTTQKCARPVTRPRIWLIGSLTADNKVFHKACFRCHHCKGILKVSSPVYACRQINCSSIGTPKIVNRSADQGHSYTEVSSMFAGTQDKCVACKKTVYPIGKVVVDGTSYHRACFRCTHGGCVISPSNYVAHKHHLYCRHHHNQLFKQK